MIPRVDVGLLARRHIDLAGLGGILVDDRHWRDLHVT